MSSRKLLLIGWDAADWSLIHPLLDRGEMPNLQRLIESGVMGNLATLQPAVASPLWTSLATGKTADQHGILGLHEPDPVTGGARLSTSTSRNCKALWNILHQNGLHTHVVNWPASYPAEPIRGVCASNIACYATADLPAGSIHPPELQATLADLRLTPKDLRGEDLALFIPELARVDQDRDPRPLALARILSEGLTAHALATWILEHQSWAFLAVYMDTMSRVGHKFMRYQAPRMDSVAEQDFELFQHVIHGVYRMHDLMLGRLLSLAGPEATVMIVSGHGFRSGDLRPAESSLEENPMLWFRKHGIFCLAGPGIRKDELVQGAGILDIAPSVLALFGLPAGEDMKGRVLREAFEEAPVIDRIESWDRTEGDAGIHPPGPAGGEQDTWDVAAALEELEALGYADALSAELQKHRAAALSHQNFNLALAHTASGRVTDAIPLLEGLARESPGEARVKVVLGQAYLYTGRLDDCRRMANDLLVLAGNESVAHIFLSTASFLQRDTAGALTHLMKAEEAGTSDPGLQALIARGYSRLGRVREAEIHFRKAIDLDPRNSGAWRGLAGALLMQKRPKEAAEAGLEAVGLDYSDAASHYALGVALALTGSIDRARQALETCVRIEPRAILAHRWLETIHRRATGDLDRARQHREKISELETVYASV